MKLYQLCTFTMGVQFNMRHFICHSFDGLIKLFYDTASGLPCWFHLEKHLLKLTVERPVM